MFKPLLTGLAVVFAFAAVSAQARTSYILPYNFAPTDAYVTAQAATSENVFTPEGALKIDAFQLIDSSGVVTTAKGVTFKEVTLFESALPHEGTFRLTTGNREMRTMQMMQVDGQWRPVRGPGGPGGPGGQGKPAEGVAQTPAQTPAQPGPQTEAKTEAKAQAPSQAIPADAKTVTVKSMMRADSYISYKKPSDTLPPAEGKGLEIVPVTHPSRLFSGNAFDFIVTFDGQPLSGVTYKVSRGGDQYADSSYAFSADSAAGGKGEVVFQTPGIYVIEMSRKWLDGDMSDPRNWSYSLTVEVAP
ncbi:DUF4198 domain-containing protein [Asticcacaulis sp. 201]|uniref:DUF4198 domain-containing protein n=1 Tax=Asticcacaulis sp. 201 TaxID=3028787 RepID=UPI00291626BF|nr:DUF4198 domain-containing protein [Asticcacaulis sp. 201]MDV6330248.1 DUF4198 domain-containing protein [Asticcacaulis sp. 201]